MNRFIKTLEKSNGDLDYRKLTAFSSYVIGGACGVFIVISDLVLTKEINPYAIGVVGLFFGLASGQTYFSMQNKKIDNNINHDGGSN
jgi:hypothetical protein